MRIDNCQQKKINDRKKERIPFQMQNKTSLIPSKRSAKLSYFFLQIKRKSFRNFIAREHIEEKNVFFMPLRQ